MSTVKHVPRLPMPVRVIHESHRPTAVVLTIDDYEDLLEQANPRIRQELAAARRDILAGRTISHEAVKKQLGL